MKQPSPKYPCPCCGNLTLSAKPPMTYEICDECDWEDDGYEADGGANYISIVENRRRYLQRRGASTS